MNIHEAAKTGSPFSHPDMIGAFKIIGRSWVHRYNISDFDNDEFINTNCLGCYFTWGVSSEDILRDDWYTI